MEDPGIIVYVIILKLLRIYLLKGNDTKCFSSSKNVVFHKNISVFYVLQNHQLLKLPETIIEENEKLAFVRKYVML